MSTLLDPRLVGCRRLYLRNLELPVRIGAHDFEKRAAQRLRINVDLYVRLADSSSRNDELRDVVDYDFIRNSVLTRLERGHIHLQETLCDDLLATMLAHPRVHAARVSTAKPDVYADFGEVGVEVFGFRQPQG